MLAQQRMAREDLSEELDNEETDEFDRLRKVSWSEKVQEIQTALRNITNKGKGLLASL